MQAEQEPNEAIMDFVKEFLEMNGYDKTLQNLEKQLKVKPLPASVPATSPHAPALNRIFEAENLYVEEPESKHEKELKELCR